MNRWIGILICIALNVIARAQTCTVTGTVLDPTGAAVVGADVQLHTPATEESTTDLHGGFTFHCTGNDLYQLTVHADGFADSQLSGRGSRNITVQLRIADVHTDVEVGENGGVSVDADKTRRSNWTSPPHA